MLQKAPTVLRTKLLKCMGALTILAIAACDHEPTAPIAPSHATPSAPRATVAAGTIQVFTDRDAWLAAVAAEGATSAAVDYTGLTMGRISSRSQDYAGRFRMAVDLLSSSSFSNPGIDIIPDINCGIGTGDCTRMLFNMIDPAWQSASPPFDMPKVDSLVFPQPVKAFAAFFSQTGWAVGCGSGCPMEIGATSIHLGGVDYDLKTIIPGGFGFVGFVVGTPTAAITFTYAKGSFSFVNDIIEVYNPEVAFGSATKTPTEQVNDLRGAITTGSYATNVRNSLTSKLDNTLAALGASNTPLACSYLQDALNFIRAQTGKKLSPSDATSLNATIGDIRTALGCT